ncbi:hypothetical protein KCM76_05515 [Zooshikella marina]|uniref:hypothetical protein n=1 Tax=Zooshikella ganghwensis TaxID=202772 RepID=UPI001BAE99E2|nr:hypothetical protein [Zooshikella ganghwensis]MBU2705426.1 hypothetical protein [Zooshikella ganghwensis]
MIWNIPILINTFNKESKLLNVDNSLLTKKHRWEDIAAALGMGNLPAESYYLGRYFIFNDEQDIQKLEELLTIEIKYLAVMKEWQVGKVNLPAMATLICNELKIMTVCTYCEGLGFESDGEDCQRCKGYGWKSFSEREKYQFIGANYQAWHRRWQGRYMQLLNFIGDAAYVLRMHLNHQLY